MNNSSKLTELLVKLRDARAKNDRHGFIVTLPIKEIDGICQLDCKLRCYLCPDAECESISFDVGTTFNNQTLLFGFEQRSASEGECLTEEEIGEFSVKLLEEVLPNLKLCRNGRMSFEKDSDDAMVYEIVDLFGVIEMPNLVVENCECSVCYEKTYVKTDCDHSLCYRCWSKVKKVEGLVPCPICRESIWRTKENE